MMLSVSVIILCFSCCSQKKEEAPDKSGTEKQQKERGNISVQSNQSFLDFCYGLPPSLGKTLSPTLIEQIKSIASDTTNLGAPLPPSASNFILRGPPDSDVLSLEVKLNSNKLAGLDFTLKLSHEFAEKHKTDLLATYREVGSRSIELLNDKLEIVAYPAFDYRNRQNSNLYAVTFNTEGLTRLVLFDSLSVSADQVIPTTDSLPPGLLEKARDMIKKQNE